MQLAELVADHFRRIGRDLGAHRRRPFLAFLGDDAAHVVGGVEDVGAGALDDFHQQGLFAVEGGVAGRVLERAAHFGDIAERHDGVGRALDRQAERVSAGADDARNLDGKAALSGVDQAGRDQLVVRIHNREDFLVGNIVGFELDRIDDDLEQVFALALDAGFEDAGIGFEALTQVFRDPAKAALGRVAIDVDHQHGELRGVEFGDDGFARVGGEIAFRHVHLVLDVQHGLVDVHVDLELQHQLRGAFTGIGAEGFQAFERLDLFFHRPHEQALGIFRRHAGERDGDRDEGDRYVRVGFLGQADIGRCSGQHGADQDGNHHPGPANGTINQTVHGRAPPWATGRTFTPSLR